jgi:hypothetical protein
MNAPPHRRVNLAQRDLDLVNGARSAHRIGVIITESADALIPARHAGRPHQGQSSSPGRHRKAAAPDTGNLHWPQ